MGRFIFCISLSLRCGFCPLVAKVDTALKKWRKFSFIPSTCFIINYNNGVRVRQSVEHHLHLIHLFFAKCGGRVGWDAETKAAFQQKQNRASSSSAIIIVRPHEPAALWLVWGSQMRRGGGVESQRNSSSIDFRSDGWSVCVCSP